MIFFSFLDAVFLLSSIHQFGNGWVLGSSLIMQDTVRSMCIIHVFYNHKAYTKNSHAVSSLLCVRHTFTERTIVLLNVILYVHIHTDSVHKAEGGASVSARAGAWKVPGKCRTSA